MLESTRLEPCLSHRHCCFAFRYYCPKTLNWERRSWCKMSKHFVSRDWRPGARSKTVTESYRQRNLSKMWPS